jgi:hypothetical protein
MNLTERSRTSGTSQNREADRAKLERLQAKIAVALAQAEAGDIIETTAAGILIALQAESPNHGRGG